MKVILKSDVERLGKTGDVVNVAVGYARNYLFPQGKALEASARNMEVIEVEKKNVAKTQERKKSESEALAEKLEQLSLTISKQAGENDKLFGTVTAMEIAGALEKEGQVIDKRKIMLEEPIKTLGIYSIPIRLHAEVTAQVKVWVVKE
jgi:large subunit ribosomal protein L9